MHFYILKNKTSEKEREEIFHIHNSIKSNKMLGNKFNQACEWSITRTRFCSKKSKMTQANGKISHVDELEELILLNYPYLPKAIYKFKAVPIKEFQCYSSQK